MNKKHEEAPIEEVIEPIEIVESIEPPVHVGEIKNPRKGVFFPNLQEGFPFAGEFESDEEAEEANKQYLNKMKGSN